MHSFGSIFMIHQLMDEGHSISAIARKLNMDRKTVRKHLQRGLEPPIYNPRPAVVSVLEPFKPYLLQKLSAYPDFLPRVCCERLKS